MKRDNIGFEYDLKKDNAEWENVIKIAFDKNLNTEVRHQAFTLLRIRNIVQDGIKANGIFSGIKLGKEKGQIIESESAIKGTGIGVDNILGGHSGRIYFSMPKNSTVTKKREGLGSSLISGIKYFSDKNPENEKYNDLLLDIVANTKNAKNKFSNLGNAKEQIGYGIGTFIKAVSSLSAHTYGAEDVKLNGLYSRLAATHGANEIDGRASEAKLESIKELGNLAKKFSTAESSKHFGVDFVSYDENNKLVSDGNRGHMYINSTYTKNYSAFGIGLEGFAPGKGSHDTSGNADLYSAFGGPKYYIKVKKGDKNFNEYIKNYCKQVFPNLDENQLQIKIKEVNKNTLDQLSGKDSKEAFEHIVVKVGENEQIDIVKSKDDSTYYIVSELAKKKLMEGDTLPKYHDGMRIVINTENHQEFLKNIEKRRDEVEKYATIEDNVISAFDINGATCLKGVPEEDLKKFLQEALCSKKDNITDLLDEIDKKINKVEEIDKPSSMNGNNNKKGSFSEEIKKSDKPTTHVYKQNNRSKSVDRFII